MSDFEDGVLQAKHGKAIHAGLFINEERAEWADFSVPIHQVKTGVLYNRDFNKSTKLSEQQNIIVAAFSGNFQASFIKDNYPQVKLLTFARADIVFNKLLEGEIQAIVAEIPFLVNGVASRKLNGVFTLSDETLLNNQVHAVIAKGQPELVKIINKGIKNIPIQQLINLEKTWLPSLNPFFQEFGPLAQLTISEKEWLLSHRNLSLGVDSQWYPFDFTDNNGEFSGIAADYINYISNVLDITIEPITDSTWIESLNNTRLGKVDMLAAVGITEDRLEYLNYTESYFSAPIVIVTNKYSFYAKDMQSLFGKTLGLIKGYALIDWVKRDFPEINIQPVDSIVDALEMVNSGNLDAYLGPITIVNSEIRKRKLNNLQISAFAPFDFNIHMAVRKGLEPLVPIINKVLLNMDDKKKAIIANNWLAVHVGNGTKSKTILLWGIPIFAIFSLIILIITRLNKHLKHEIVNRIRVEKELKYLAQHDELTGLANRRLFEELSLIELNRNMIDNSQQALLFVDIDGFKIVNDSHGHKIGDLLLIAIAKRLNDSLGDAHILARLGGDEFIIYLFESINKETTENIASCILESLAEPYNLTDIQVDISASIGISLVPQDGRDIETLMKNADAAMYQAKKSGRNIYKFYSKP